MVQAVKNLPQQQQLLICAATKLLGGHKQEPATSAANQPTTSGLSGLPRKASLQAFLENSLPLLPWPVHFVVQHVANIRHVHSLQFIYLFHLYERKLKADSKLDCLAAVWVYLGRVPASAKQSRSSVHAFS